MLPDPPIEAILSAEADWARLEPLIRFVWLFGSRARGDHRPDSDIDLAVSHDIDPEFLRQVRGDVAWAQALTWSGCHKRGVATLASAFRVPVHVEVIGRDDQRVRPAVLRDGLLLYWRGRLLLTQCR
ncbi:nucleotidyltransferase domain-containing protein [Neoroseomonas lacus]|uniref:Polymerase beta nucleotidyltransferase domain-containing protein n=1 Tax=Neoroseomonas lacus TaxID=287609 RepID=A0A917NKH1_9PROT|nr:nucleotidyltransferase domain-containing protein [Neoroseomonas lacus]GGJ04563.1 hypothetical protein GCM10011320_09310 [Neoroseomonas lacus]